MTRRVVRQQPLAADAPVMLVDLLNTRRELTPLPLVGVVVDEAVRWSA